MKHSHCKGASMVAQLVKNLPEMQENLVQFLDWEVPWRRDKLHIPVFLDFPGGSDSKESTCNAGDLSLIPGLGISSGEEKGYPLQYSGLENSTDCIVPGVPKSWAQLSDFHFYFPCRERQGHDWLFCTWVSSCPSTVQDTVLSSGRAMAPVLGPNDLESKGLFPHSTMIKKIYLNTCNTMSWLLQPCL